MEVSLDRRVLDGQVYQPICLCLVSTQPMFSVLQVTASVRSLSFLCSVYTCTYILMYTVYIVYVLCTLGCCGYCVSSECKIGYH